MIMGRFGQIESILTHDHGRLRDGGAGAASGESALACARPYFAGRGRHVVAVSTEDHMTETIARPETQAEPPHIIPRPATDGAAVRAIEHAADHVRERALQIGAKILATVEQHPGASQPAAG
jgi:hypothetical protein